MIYPSICPNCQSTRTCLCGVCQYNPGWEIKTVWSRCEELEKKYHMALEYLDRIESEADIGCLKIKEIANEAFKFLGVER